MENVKNLDIILARSLQFSSIVDLSHKMENVKNLDIILARTLQFSINKIFNFIESELLLSFYRLQAYLLRKNLIFNQKKNS